MTIRDIVDSSDSWFIISSIKIANYFRISMFGMADEAIRPFVPRIHDIQLYFSEFIGVLLHAQNNKTYGNVFLLRKHWHLLYYEFVKSSTSFNMFIIETLERISRSRSRIFVSVIQRLSPLGFRSHWQEMSFVIDRGGPRAHRSECVAATSECSQHSGHWDRWFQMACRTR